MTTYQELRPLIERLLQDKRGRTVLKGHCFNIIGMMIESRDVDMLTMVMSKLPESDAREVLEISYKED